jgi:hypothetical protein
MMRKLGLASIVAALVVAAPMAVLAGVSGPAFYVDGEVYRTVGTPTDFSATGAPAHSFDTIYQFAGAQALNVATAAPGDRDFNGGRWMVLPITWHVDPVQLTSAEQVEAYADAGWLTIGATPLRMFECPVIPLRGN